MNKPMNFVTKNRNYAKSNDLFKRPQFTSKEKENLANNQEFKNQFIKWNTFMKENYDMFATWYLGLDLFLYQKIVLHFMGKANQAMIVASRGISKSFMISIFACCKAILEPGSIIIIASPTRGQSNLILKEKIQGELCRMSPNLKREIKDIKTGQNEGSIYFHNGSRILTVTASENSRGYRSNCNLYEEKAKMNKSVIDTVLSPFLIPRQAPYLKKHEYSHLKVDPCQLSITSAWYKSLEWFWEEIKRIGQDMVCGIEDQVCFGFDYHLAVHEGLKSKRAMEQEKAKSDEIGFAIEYENVMYDSEGSFFTYDLFKNTKKVKKAIYPRTSEEVASGKKIKRLAKNDGVIRVLSCDIAMSSGSTNDNSIYTLAELIPMKGYYLRRIIYIESHNGKTAMEQAVRIRRLISDFDVDTCVLDCLTIGLPVLDLLGEQLVDDETGEEYRPLCAYNDEDLKARCRVQNAIPMIFGMRANSQLNSDMIVEMKALFQQNKVEMLVDESEAENFLTKTNKLYKDGELEKRAEMMLPYVQTSLAINECIQLETELRQGRIAVKERGTNTKDRFSSILYLCWVSSLIEKENMREDNKSNVDFSRLLRFNQPITKRNKLF